MSLIQMQSHPRLISRHDAVLGRRPPVILSRPMVGDRELLPWRFFLGYGGRSQQACNRAQKEEGEMQGYAVAAGGSPGAASWVNNGGRRGGAGAMPGAARTGRQVQWRGGMEWTTAAPIQGCSTSWQVQALPVGAAREADAKERTGEVWYQALESLLEAGEWEAADAETRRLLIVLAGEGAVQRKWVYFSELRFINEEDLRTVDELWLKYSNGKFGYSVQRKIWKSVDESYTRFFKKVGWTRPLNDKVDAYKKFPMEFSWDVNDPTPTGHLPLTNCLRGTQLLCELLNHPAFAEADEEEADLIPPSNLQSLMGSAALKALF